jgi:hypothetical protein
MSNFVKDTDPTPLLPGTKIEVPAPVGLDSGYITGADTNKLRVALLDLRTEARGGRELNVKHFGAVGDGVTNDTAAFVACFAACTPGTMVYVPPGTYMVAYGRAGGTAPIKLPDYCNLRGDGPEASIIKAIANTITTDSSWRLLECGDHTTVRRVCFDGNKANQSLSGTTTSYSVLVYAGFGYSPGVTSFLADEVWCHDAPACTGKEAFGLMATNGKNVWFIDCRSFNHQGTGFHFSGSINVNAATSGNWDDEPPGTMFDGGLMIGCEGWGNNWQGISCYGAKNVRAYSSRFYNNNQHGINAEWCKNVEFHGCESTGNYYAGLGTYGKANVRAYNCNIWGNNLGGSPNLHGEVEAKSGAWFTGSPAANAHAGTIELYNCRVSPTAGSRHVYYNFDPSVNIGNAWPDKILIDCADAANWLIGNEASQFARYACVEIRGVDVRVPGPESRIADYTVAGSITNAAYAGTGNVSPNARTLTSSTQFANVFGRNGMQAGRTYRVRMRCKMEDTNASWTILAQQGASSATQFFLGRFDAVSAKASAIGTWVQHDAILAVPTTATDNYRLQINRDTATGSASSFSVDYIAVEELSTPSPTGELFGLLGRVVGHGTAAPTTGTWTASDIILSDTPAQGGQHNIGWVCVTTGTPGTWREFGHVGTDTDAPAFGSSSGVGSVSIDGPAASLRQLMFNTAGVNRWYIRANNTAETGSNAGSDLEFSARDDSGAFLSLPLTITRSTGVVNATKLTIGSGTPILKVLSATATWDPPSTATGALSTATTVTLTGAALGDNVKASFSLALPDGCYLVAQVSATNTVKVQLANFSGSTQDLASGTLRVTVEQF